MTPWLVSLAGIEVAGLLHSPEVVVLAFGYALGFGISTARTATEAARRHFTTGAASTRPGERP